MLGHVSPVGGTHSHTLYKISIVTQTLDVLLKLIFLDFCLLFDFIFKLQIISLHFYTHI